MAQVVRHGLAMRSSYHPPKLAMGGWFPKHMYKGLMQMQAKLRTIDAIIEVHDARIPFTGRNPKLSDVGIVKPSILVFNKADLISDESREVIKTNFNHLRTEVLFTNSKDSNNSTIRSIVPQLLESLKTADRFNRAESTGVHLMVVGVPNVGKSSLINALRHCNMHRKRGAEVAPRPGVTKHVMEKIQVWWSPVVYVRDTPGVLAPRVANAEAGMRLALVDAVHDGMVERESVADFLLYWLNSNGRRQYVEEFQLSGPTDNLRQLLLNIAVRKDLSYERRGQKYPDLTRAAELFIGRWRAGAFGCGMLDCRY